MRFEPTAPWVAPAAGQSRQLIDLTQDNRRAANWGVNPLVPVTPGASNSVASALPPFDPLWLNEFQHASLAVPVLLDDLGEPSPWLELHNAGAAPVSLANYFLTVNFTFEPHPLAVPAWGRPGARRTQDHLD